MKIRNIENRLAYFGVLIVLIGVTFAAGSAFGSVPADARTAVVSERNSDDETIIGARKAMAESAAEAAESLKAENAFDLDTQLADLTSTLRANAR